MYDLLKGYGIKLLVIAGLLTACQGQTDHYVQVTNPLSKTRPDARITMVRNQLAEIYPYLIKGTFVVQNDEGENVPFQRDDMNGDGQWDQLALLLDLPANGSAKLMLREADEVPDFTDRANIWFAKRDSATGEYNPITEEMRPEGYHRIMNPPYLYQFEGPGWENDKMGFRMYFDNRNANDIWGKKTTDMVLSQIGTGEDYHTMQPWGMDVLHVGRSLGAGGIAAMDGDSLYALGATDQAEFTQVADGPVRAVLDLTYRGWKVGSQNLDIRERISIWGGQQGFQNEVSLLNSDTQTTLAAGIVTVKLPGKPDFAGDQAPFPYVAGWGAQSQHHDNLGMAVVGTSKSFQGYGQRFLNPNGVDSTAFAKFTLSSDQPVPYRFVAGWEVGDPGFARKAYFMKAVSDEGERLNNPVQVQMH